MLRLAYGSQSGNLYNLNFIEHFLDGIFLFEIISTFFIGIPLDETSIHAHAQFESKVAYNRNMAEIALKYVKTTFITDLLSLMPKIYDWGSKLYFLKVVRLFHFFKTSYKFEDLIQWLKTKFEISHYDKIRTYLLVWFDILMYIHTACCVWIWIGR